MLTECRSLDERPVVPRQNRPIRPVDRDVEVAEQDVAELNVGQAEFRPRQIPVLRQPRLGDIEPLGLITDFYGPATGLAVSAGLLVASGIAFGLFAPETWKGRR